MNQLRLLECKSLGLIMSTLFSSSSTTKSWSRVNIRWTKRVPRPPKSAMWFGEETEVVLSQSSTVIEYDPIGSSTSTSLSTTSNLSLWRREKNTIFIVCFMHLSIWISYQTVSRGMCHRENFRPCWVVIIFDLSGYATLIPISSDWRTKDLYNWIALR